MKHIISLFLVLIMVLTQLPVQATPEMGYYTVVITSPDLADYFGLNPKYKKDFYTILHRWEDLGPVLDQVSKRSKGQLVYIDFMVHGDPYGLYLQEPFNPAKNYDRASMGYVLNTLKRTYKC